MSEHERGAYAPPTADAPLSFDARQPVRGARPFPITLILSGLVLVGLIAVIVVFYRSGVRAAGQAPESVGAPVGALKSPAPADAQPEDPAAGLQIYQEEAGQPAAPAQPQFTAPPEQPAARPTAAAPPPSPQPAPAIRETMAAPAPPPTQPKPVVAAPKPAAAQLARPKRPAEKAPAKAAAAKAPPEPLKAAGGVASVQIGAVSSIALADKAWNGAVAAAPGMAAGKGKGVEKIDKDGKTLYRTAVTGFASRAEASAFCARLKSAGKACFVK